MSAEQYLRPYLSPQSNDFFGGWQESDIELLSRYLFQQGRRPRPGALLDWLGIFTDFGHHPAMTIPDNRIIDLAILPIPDDMVHAEAIEYIALVVALERALAAGRQRYCCVELGASYGPWVCASGVLARRHGFSVIDLIAVEASERTVPLIAQHALLNDLTADNGVTLRAIHGAAHLEDGTLFFPKVDTASDNGAQVTAEVRDVDYRGLQSSYEEVRSYSLASICKDVGQVDFMHLDLQGAEEALIVDEAFLDTLTGKVATFFFATQSRFIEGLALRTLPARGWKLVRERPTTYRMNERTADINGWTLRDGGQLWLNPKFGDRFLDL